MSIEARQTFALYIHRGKATVFEFQITKGGVPEDLTGWGRRRFIAKREWTDSDGAAILSLDSDSNQIPVLDASVGRMNVEVPYAATLAVTNTRVHRLVAQLQQVNPQGSPEILAAGVVDILPTTVGASD